MKSAIAACKMGAFALWTLLIVPLQILVMAFHRGPYSYYLPYFWHKGVCLIFGIRVRIEGKPVQKQQTLYTSNHLSYLDIPVIGTVLHGSFVAKSDVASWPVFGFLAQMQQTAFISRARGDAARGRNALGNMLAEGKSLIIFPEGTSTDGTELFPFKSSMFSLALRDGAGSLLIQPFSLKVDQVDGSKPVTQDDRDLYAWHYKMTTELPEHLWRFAHTSGARITLKFYDVLKAGDYADRKVLAKTCHERVSKGLDLALSQAA